MSLRNGYLVTVFWPALRVLHKMRKHPETPHRHFTVESTDSIQLFCTMLGDNREAAIVVAHPAITGSALGQVVDLADELARSFSVITFDFRGHGKSSGRCPVGFSRAASDLHAVVEEVGRMGFGKIGFAGFSLGAAAGFLVESREHCFDCFVSIGCPPSLPDVGPWSQHPLISRICARILGMRLDPTLDGGPDPLDVAADMPAVPKLVVFGEHEVASPEEIEVFIGRISSPKDIMTIPGVWHADLGGREALIREWLQSALT